MGNLYVTVSTDEDGEPFEVFGWLGKGGSFQHGVTELACRLISLHLRRGTPLDEIIDQCRGIQEMQPFFNRLPDGKSIAVLGIGDGIAHVLKQHLKAREEREGRRSSQGRLKKGTDNGRRAHNDGAVSTRGRPRFSSTGNRQRKDTT